MADRSHGALVEDLIEAMRVLTGPDGIDATVPDVPCRDPAQANLAELRVAFFTDNGIAAADGEVAGVVRERLGLLPPWFARWRNPARPV